VTEVLVGTHRALGADISFQQDRTISRQALLREHGAQIFHLDAWSLVPTAQDLARALPHSQAQRDMSENDMVQQMSLAMYLAGISAMSALCRPDSTLIIR
jgi:hypothetical protein